MTKLTETEKYQLLFDFGRRYLLRFKEINKEILYNHLYLKKLTTIEDVYKRFLHSLKNRNRMNNVIGEFENLTKFDEVICYYKPKSVLKKYEGSWEAFFKEVKGVCKPERKMTIDEPRSLWVQFCKGAIDGARWLSQPELQNFKKSLMENLLF